MAIYGRKPYGYGTPAVEQDLGGKVTKNPYTGRQEGSRKIDPATKDYAIDTVTGRVRGMTNPQQLVYLAVSTTRGTSAMRRLGHDLLSIDRITSNFVRRVDGTLRAAVQHIVDREIIEVIGTEVSIVRPGVALTRLRWRDLETGDEEETLVGDRPQSAREGLALPTITLLSSDIADTAGGDSITVTGYRIASASACTVGGTSATITANTATSLTFTMPAKTAGTYDVSVTTASGTSNPLSIEAWSPAAITGATGFWRGSFAGSPWAGQVSSRDLTEATFVPATGSAVNGYTSADFNGTDDLLSSAANASTFFSTTGYGMAALIYVDAFTTGDPGATAPHSVPNILGEPNGGEGPTGGVAGTGAAGVFRWGHYDTTTAAYKSTTVDIATGEWVLVRATYDGTSIKVAKNDGEWAIVAADNPALLFAQPLKVGTSNGGTWYLDGKMLLGFTANVEVSDEDFDKARRYCNLRFALSL